MKLYTMTEQDMTSNMNEAKEVLVRALVSEKIINKDDARKILEYYTIIATRKGWFGRTWDKVRGTTKDQIAIQVVKGCNYADLYPDVSKVEEQAVKESA